ncbi:MAG: tRNA (uridine(34)/cytosine(34)/5-carboxymethylaminomethyluridine(34)-2'-O)-methyltransferase TrmL [Candidatus Marinimicrobia bacterium]|nr:tRNA (uridine(34)/cytosine(34)/5-carboxymethylaminomethyluridine(34)-2'-O)-methyltransferase TrmL [Candidatus Neomarinimicrobiota bacterium]
MIQIALFEPEIPPNTGNIIRLCANTGFTLHLIEPLGFNVDDKSLRRAGLDYHAQASMTIHKDFDTFHSHFKNSRIFSVTTKAKQDYTSIEYQKNDILLFGPESRGLPENIRTMFPQIRIPMQPDSRSLNLANSVSIVMYEAWRQFGFDGRVE